MIKKIQRALISVSDKTGIIDLAQFLERQEVEIISTGGTYQLLKQQKIKVLEISEFTGFPEIMGGRVKTLHPKVHGALLGILDDQTHLKQAEEQQILAIDLLVVNLYPFIQTVKQTPNHQEIIENIDIGGPSMIRSAAKNYLYKTVITNPKDYDGLIAEISHHQGGVSLPYREDMARRAFITTANYDQAIAFYFCQKQEQKFPEKLLLPPASLKQKLRYGENPHQEAAVYKLDLQDTEGLVNAKQLQGKELSYNNFSDAEAAFNIALEFKEPAAAIVKHNNPCGVALADNIEQAYYHAFEADSKSAFGGIVALNRPVEKALASELSKIFYEVIIAPSFSDEAKEILASKKNLRLLQLEFKRQEYSEIKAISGGFLVQEADTKIFSPKDLVTAGKISAGTEQIKQLLFAMSVCKNVKSNAIVLANGLQTVGVGAGQTSRVEAVKAACQKASNFETLDKKIINKAKGAVLASDAFFPFTDNIEIAASYGIKAIVAPSGSIRDKEIIEKANEHNIALLFTASRHFKH